MKKCRDAGSIKHIIFDFRIFLLNYKQRHIHELGLCMLSQVGNRVSFHSTSNVEAVEIAKTSAKHELNKLHAFIVKVQPFTVSFAPIDSLLISMVLKGRAVGVLEVDGLEHEIVFQPGAITILPPDTHLNLTLKDPAEFINIYISKKVLNDVIIEFSSEGNNLLRLDHNLSVYDEFIEQTINSLKDVLYSDDRFSSIEVQYIARVLVARVVSKYSTNASENLNTDAGLSVPVLQSIFDFIDENLHRRIVIDRLATKAGVGAAQFARLFKRATNVTLHQYIIKRRVDRSRDLLAETDMPIAEIAHECGFADQVHLTRFFGRIVGTSPASFRKKYKKI